MPMKQQPISEKNIKILFAYSLFLKAVFSVFEIISGSLVFLVTKQYLMNKIALLTAGELSQDPNDLFSHYLIKIAQTFSIDSKHFVGLYLLSHGTIKLFLIINLFRGKMWAYPVSIAVFSLFIVYEVNRFLHTHSPWLLLFTFFDVVVIALTAHEYTYNKKLSKKERIVAFP